MARKGSSRPNGGTELASSSRRKQTFSDGNNNSVHCTASLINKRQKTKKQTSKLVRLDTFWNPPPGSLLKFLHPVCCFITAANLSQGLKFGDLLFFVCVCVDLKGYCCSHFPAVINLRSTGRPGSWSCVEPRSVHGSVPQGPQPANRHPNIPARVLLPFFARVSLFCQSWAEDSLSTGHACT